MSIVKTTFAKSVILFLLFLCAGFSNQAFAQIGTTGKPPAGSGGLNPIDSTKIATRDSLLRIAVRDSILRARTFQNKTSLGPFVTLGLSRFLGTAPNEAKAGMGFSYDIGSILYIATGSNSSLFGGFYYTSRSLPLNSPSAGVDNYTFDYLGLNVGLRYSIFQLGIGFGLPMSGSRITDASIVETGVAEGSGNENVDVSEIAALTEARFGISYPIAELEYGAMQAIALVTYSLNQPLANKPEYQGKIVSFQVGLTYQFDMDQ